MSDYIYRGFKVHFIVSPVKNEPTLFQANGVVECIADNQKTPPQKFHTESDSLENAQAEIKKLIEDYINFEWKEYERMRLEKE